MRNMDEPTLPATWFPITQERSVRRNDFFPHARTGEAAHT
jgi:hypothetical protein